MNLQRTSRRSLLSYGLLALPIAFAGMPLYILAPDFYASHYGFSLTALAITLLVLRLLDAFQDPLIGALSDRYGTYRIRIMTAACLFLVAGFVALFHPPSNPSIGWFIGCIFLATTAYSVLSINLNATGALWGQNESEQSRIAGVREGLGLLGLILAVTLPSVIDDKPFTWVSGALIALLGAGMLCFVAWYRPRQRFVTRYAPMKLMAAFRRLGFVNTSFFLIYGMSVLASSIPAALVVFYVRDVLHAESLLGLFLLVYFVAGAIGMRLWHWVGIKRSKYHAWLLSMLLAVASFAGAYVLGPGDITPYLLICLLSGIAFGADLMLPPAILADHMQASGQQEVANGSYGILAFLTKASLAIGTGFALLMLDMSGYVAGQPNDAVAVSSLGLVYAIVPCAIKLMACAVLWMLKTTFEHGVHYAPASSRAHRSHTHA